MIIKKIILSFFSFFMAFTSFGQIIEGEVLDAITKQPLSGVVIKNTRTQDSVISNLKGYFEIKVREGQSLSFVKNNYDKNFAVIGNETFICVGMTKHLSLSTIIKKEPHLNTYQQDSIDRRAPYDVILRQPNAKVKISAAFPYGIAIQSPISSWLQYIMPRTKREIAFKKHYKKWEEDKYIEYKYNTVLVSELTGLPTNKSLQFIAQYPMEFDYARAASDDEIKMWIMYNFREWKKKNP